MVLFQSPSVTRYDLRFTLAGIPVRVHPLFWVMGLILGSGTGNLISILIWVLVVFVSILLHEMGHALTMRYYGQAAEVVLYLGGGLAVPQSDIGTRRSQGGLTVGQRALISLAGPGTGFLVALWLIIVIVMMGGTVHYTPIAGIVPAVTPYLPRAGWLVYAVVDALLWINIFWGMINLIPAQPLDGGNIAHDYITNADPLNGERKAIWVSLIAAVVGVVIGFLMQSIYVMLLFIFLGIQSYEKVKGGARIF